MTTKNSAVTVNSDDAVTITAFREEIALEIRSHLDSIGTSYLAVGKALNEVREDFEKQQEFLAWVSAEFGIQKAQCYNLMKVGKVFGDDARFKGVAMRVLAILAKYVDDEAVMNRAADVAKAGNLDSQALEAILAPAKPAPATTTQVRNMAANDGNTQENALDAGAPSTDGPTVVEMSPPNVVINGEEVEATPAATLPEGASIVSTASNERERALLSHIETLKKVIEQLQEASRKGDTERDSKVKAAPMLPQFKSKTMYARLGLSLEEAQDAKKVKKAQRELVKLGYGEGHAAWAAISEAVTALISA